MKSFQFLVLLCLVLLALLVCFPSPNSTLKQGDISFIQLDAKENSFGIKVGAEVRPNTVVQFTDSEWDGLKFGLDEGNMVWNTGEQAIPAGTVVYFSLQNNIPSASIGIVNGMLKISKNKDAIFAYIGLERIPKRFLAAVANHVTAFGVLDNTGLDLGKTAIVFNSENQRITGKISDLAVVGN